MKKIIYQILTIMIITIQIFLLTGIYQEVGAKEEIKKGEEFPNYFQYYDEKMKEWKTYKGSVEYDVITKKPIFILDKEINRIYAWKIVKEGINGNKPQKWGLDKNIDLYIATKIALESIVKNLEPQQWIKPIQEEQVKLLTVAQTLYQEGKKERMGYSSAKINIIKQSEEKQKLEGEEYYLQKYQISSSKEILEYQLQLQGFTKNTKLLNQNKEILKKQDDNYQISDTILYLAVPVKEIQKDITGNIVIKNAKVKTCPIQFTSQNHSFQITCLGEYEMIETSQEVLIKHKGYDLTISTYGDLSKEVPLNATYRVTNQEGKIIGEYKTKDDGKIVITELETPVVYVEQIQVPDLYQIHSTKEKIELKWGENVEKEFWNRKKQGKIQIHIKNNEKNIEGVYLELYNVEGELITTKVSDTEGKIEFLCFEMGSYIIKENGGILGDEAIQVELKNDGQIIKIELEQNENNIKEIEKANEENENVNKQEKAKEDTNLANSEIKKLPRTGF